MIFAGLDVATVTGLAAIDGEKVTTATYRSPKKKGDVFGDADKSGKIDAIHTGAIGVGFEDYLRSWLIANRVTHAAVEMPIRSNATRTKTTVDPQARFAGKAIHKETVAITSMATIYRLYGLSFLALTVCARLQIPCRLVNQSEWRKAFLGTGTTKDAKQSAVVQCKRLGIAYSSVDACEALGIAWYLRGELSPANYRQANNLFNLPPTTGEPSSRG